MNDIELKVIQKIDRLIEKGDIAKEAYIPSPPQTIGFGHLDHALFNEWKSGSESLILHVVGREVNYYANFVEKTEKPQKSSVESGVGILRALREDIEGGFLVEVKDLAMAEIFSNFLDMARHLLENGYKDSAASLGGAVLEDSLRKIAVKNNIEVRDGDDIGSLNMKLADKGIYNRLKQKNIQTWKTVRNSADHGKFHEYTTEDVDDMLSGVERFLSKNL